MTKMAFQHHHPYQNTRSIAQNNGWIKAPSYPPISISSKTPWSLRSSVSESIERVAVCTGELCQCQEIGGDEILANLLSRNEPYEIEETVCLGACGVDAMVSIEYKDGTDFLAMGLQETLETLGLDYAEGESTLQQQEKELSQQRQQLVVEIKEEEEKIESIPFAEKEKETVTALQSSEEQSPNSKVTIPSISSTNAIPTTTKVVTESTETPSSPILTSDKKELQVNNEHAARDRMRAAAAAAAAKEETVSPWAYLAKKAWESVVGDKE